MLLMCVSPDASFSTAATKRAISSSFECDILAGRLTILLFYIYTSPVAKQVFCASYAVCWRSECAVHVQCDVHRALVAVDARRRRCRGPTQSHKQVALDGRRRLRRSAGTWFKATAISARIASTAPRTGPLTSPGPSFYSSCYFAFLFFLFCLFTFQWCYLTVTISLRSK